MARGPIPKDDRLRTNAPVHDWENTTQTGWQHGETPTPPDGLTKPSLDAWTSWFGAWFASFWSPEDLPGLRQIIRLYDQVERNEFQRSAELRMLMDAYGITPKGRQALRWRRAVDDTKPARKRSSGYSHLRAVSETG